MIRTKILDFRGLYPLISLSFISQSVIRTFLGPNPFKLAFINPNSTVTLYNVLQSLGLVSDFGVVFLYLTLLKYL